jgi:ATP-dependent DNA helicase RecG
VLPYRGYGSGILRALNRYPDIDFFDDREGNLFKVTLKRSELKECAVNHT